jgi:hypothetical protein
MKYLPESCFRDMEMTNTIMEQSNAAYIFDHGPREADTSALISGDRNGGRVYRDTAGSGVGSSSDTNPVPAPNYYINNGLANISVADSISVSQDTELHPPQPCLGVGSESWPLTIHSWSTSEEDGISYLPGVEPGADSESCIKTSPDNSSTNAHTASGAQRPTIGNEPAHGSSEFRTRWLACPFYKKDGQKYYECLKYELRRVKDVKQHVHRRHRKPDFYCARCYQIFDTSYARDVHTRKMECVIRVKPQFDGISDQKKKALNRSDREKGIEEQWYSMWDIMFPDEQRPRSVYIGNHGEEMMPLIRQFWDKRGSEVLSHLLGTGMAADMHSSKINTIMSTVFDHLEIELSGSGAQPDTARTAQEPKINFTPAESATMNARVFDPQADLVNTDLTLRISNTWEADSCFTTQDGGLPHRIWNGSIIPYDGSYFP